MTRRRLVLFLLLLAAAAAVWRAPAWGRDVLAGKLAAAFGRPASVGSLRVRLFPLRIEVRDVRVAGAHAQAPPFLELREAVARPSLLPNWRGLRLRRLHLRGLRVRVQAYERGGDDLPRLQPGAGGAEARIGRLVIDDAELIVDHRRVPLAVDLPAVHGTLAASGGALLGRLAFDAGTVRFGQRAPLQLASDMQLGLRGGRLEVPSLHVRSGRTDMSGRGALQLSPFRGEFSLAGPVDLGLLDRHVLESGFGLRGHARYLGQLRVEGSQLELQGRLDGTGGEFDGVAVDRYNGEVSWAQGRLDVRGLAVSALGGRGRFDIHLPPAPGQVRLRAELSGMDAEGLSALVFDVGAAGVGAAAEGTLDLRWPRGRHRQLSGTVALQLAARGDGRTPLSGRVDWRAEDGRQWLQEAELRTPAVQARLSGHIERDNRADLAIAADSVDLAAADDLLLRLRRALGAPAAQGADVGGSGSFRGRWRGTLEAPVFEGRFAGQDFAFLGVDWGRVEWAGSLSPLELRSHSLVLRKEGGELWLDGWQRTGVYGEDDGLELKLRLQDWPAADLAAALRWDLPLAGRLSGEAAVHGSRSRPLGRVSLRSGSGRYGGVPYEDLHLESALEGASARLRQGRARVGGGEVRFHGSRSEDGVYDAAVDLSGVDVGALAVGWPEGMRPGGRLDGTLVVQGPLQRPRLTARLRSARLFMGDEGLGALEATLTGQGDGAVRMDAHVRSARVDLRLAGAVGAAPPYVADLRLGARETSLDPFLVAAYPQLPAGVPLVASGEAVLVGPLQQPRALDLRARLDDLQVLIPDYPIKAMAPVTLTLREGRLDLGQLHVGGTGTDLVVTGALPVLDGGALQLEARGSADLRVLSVWSREVRGSGAARLAVAVSGTAAAPHLEGSLDLQEGALRVRRFPHGIEALSGTVRFTHQGAHLDGLAGVVGGAPVRLRGQAAWSRAKGVSFDVQADGEGIALRYPEGLRSTVDADLRAFGDQRLQWLTGQVTVRQAVWTRRYDVASELLAERQRSEGGPALDGGLRYDVKVSAPGTLKVDNNLATLQARAELALQGSAAAPVVLGRAQVDRGRVYFQGNTYLIRRGSIDFANPRRTEPLFDIEAETRVQSYRVTLRANGTLERVYPTLTSDPHLSQVAILSLLAGADESTVSALDTRRDDAQAGLAVTGAATLAAGKISEEVGLERGAERLFGLSRFSIDPSIVRGGVTNPTARVTMGKRLTPEMTILYSTDLRGTEERLVSMEYTLSERVSLLLTRAEPGGFGFDLRLRQSR